jgi:hypothetical protein
MRPGLGKRDAGQVGQNVDATRSDADLVGHTGRLKSSTEMSVSGAPKAVKALITRAAFSGVASIQTSRSPVARGLPCRASAYAPTMRNRTSAAVNARNRSTKSGFIAQLASKAPELLAETPHLEDPIPLGNLHPELQVVTVGLGRRREASRHQTPGTVGRLLRHVRIMPHHGHMHDVPKRTKRLVREWAGIAHERDLRKALSELRGQFERWDRNEIDSFELNDLVHRYHQDAAREIWKQYATTHLEPAVASAIVTGVLRKEEVPPELLQHLAGLLEFYEAASSGS